MKQKYLTGFAIGCLLLSSEAQNHNKIMNWKTEYPLGTYLLQNMHQTLNKKNQSINKH